jgi:hypothetical protein
LKKERKAKKAKNQNKKVNQKALKKVYQQSKKVKNKKKQTDQMKKISR